MAQYKLYEKNTHYVFSADFIMILLTLVLLKFLIDMNYNNEINEKTTTVKIKISWILQSTRIILINKIQKQKKSTINLSNYSKFCYS